MARRLPTRRTLAITLPVLVFALALPAKLLLLGGDAMPLARAEAWHSSHPGDLLDHLVVTVDLSRVRIPNDPGAASGSLSGAERIRLARNGSAASVAALQRDDGDLAGAVRAMIAAGGDPVVTIRDGVVVVADRRGRVKPIPLDPKATLPADPTADPAADPATDSAADPANGTDSDTTVQDGATPSRVHAAAPVSDPSTDRRMAAALTQLRAVPGVSTATAYAADQVLIRADHGTDLASLPFVTGSREPATASVLDLTLPDDHYLSYAWGLSNDGSGAHLGRPAVKDADTGALAAWTRTRGRGTVVAVVDTGMDVAQPDLAGRLWTNPKEPCGSVDTDHNGLRGDCHGWNFLLGNADLSNVVSGKKASDHGTGVSGTIAADLGNGVGVAGLAPQAQIMPLVVGAGENVYLPQVAQAIRYAADHGANVVNLSLGGIRLAPTADDLAVRDAIRYAATKNVLVVAAAGNDGANRDTVMMWPASFREPNELVVGASNPDDTPASFSAYGRTTVDLFAPGVDIATTGLDGSYVLMSGTSLSTPFVVAAAALVWSADPTASVSTVRRRLLDTVDRPSALAGTSITAGRLDAGSAVKASPRPLSVEVAGLDSLTPDATASATLKLLGDASGLPSGPLQVQVQLLSRVDGVTYAVAGVHLDAGAAGVVTTDGAGRATLSPAGLDAGTLPDGVDVPVVLGLPSGRYGLTVRLTSGGTWVTAAQVAVFDVGGDATASAPSGSAGAPAATSTQTAATTSATTSTATTPGTPTDRQSTGTGPATSTSTGAATPPGTSTLPGTATSTSASTATSTLPGTATSTSPGAPTLPVPPTLPEAASLPGAPSAVAAILGDGLAIVRWTTPASDGGSAVTLFTATATPGGSTCLATPPATSCTLSGLRDGVTYRVTVTASNAAGTSASSDPASVTPVAANPTTPAPSTGTPATSGPPLPPPTLAGTAGDGVAVISWTTPARDGNSPIQRYAVTATPGGGTCTASPPVTTCTLTGLTNGVRYSVTVAATNAVGTSADSPPVTVIPQSPIGDGASTGPAAPVPPPVAPTAVAPTSAPAPATTALATTDSVTTAPQPTAPRPTDPQPTDSVTTDPAPTESARTNAAATTPAAPTVGIPGPPSGLTAAAGVRSADVRWSAPVDDVAAPVLLYVASASPGGAICLAVAPATSCTLTGLVDGTAYTVTVTASSVAGTSPASAPVTVTPVAPVAPVVPVTPVVPGPAAASATSGGTPSATVRHDPAFAANWGITDLSPSSGSTEGGTDVAITGTNLPDGAIVQFGTAPATVTYASGSSLIVTAPRNVVPGPVDVTVWSPDRHYQVLSGAFSYLAPGGPARQSSAPASAPSPAASAAPSTGSTSTAGPAATSVPDAGTARLAPVSADATIPDWMWRQPGCSGRCTALTV